ncbi:hypothetical protein KR222_008663 [Zaprionus bogoriensis]|nr:hypothetical protein KR222_008663 [Zaprionus bogoriensis]
MGVKVKEVSSSAIETLRQRFNTQYASSPPAVPFHPVDIDRIRNDHVWLQRFLEQHDLDMEASFTKLWETCIWRQSYGANDLDHTQLNQEYLNEGSCFVHNKDVDGFPLLIFRVKMHNKSKSLDELMRMVVYWIEREQRAKHMTQLSIVFDMAGTSLASLDLEFVKRIVETFKLYYPNALNYILVFELAWVLNAAFKIIKSVLPPKAVEILKMITKKDITQYVTKENCLASWGGTDNYEYRFVPEAKRTSTKPMAANAGDDDQPQDDLDKKVHFAKSAKMVLHDSSIGDMHTPSDGEGMLQVEPSEFVNFCPATGEAKLKLSNVSGQPVVYKIQTTSPDKFRVRPRCGVIAPKEEAEVGIWLKPDHQLSNDSKDKFLVMATPMNSADCTSSEVAELWKEKAAADPDVENHRLVCRLGGKDGGSKGDSQGGSKVKLQQQQEQMANQIKFVRNQQYAMICLMLLLFACFGFLLYEQMKSANPNPGCPKPAAYQCPRRK